MSISVDLDALPAAVAARHAPPFLLTVGRGGPRAASVTVAWDGGGSSGSGGLTMEVGRRTADNIGRHRQVTVLWPPDAEDPDHALLVDGEAFVDGRLALVRPASAVLHVIRSG